MSMETFICKKCRRQGCFIQSEDDPDEWICKCGFSVFIAAPPVQEAGREPVESLTMDALKEMHAAFLKRDGQTKMGCLNTAYELEAVMHQLKKELRAEPASLGAEAPKKFPLLFSDDWLRSTVPSDPEGEPMAGGTTSRFYIDHGAIHDRKTGQHVGMDAEPESVERLLALLQELELQHQPIKAAGK